MDSQVYSRTYGQTRARHCTTRCVLAGNHNPTQVDEKQHKSSRRRRTQYLPLSMRIEASVSRGSRDGWISERTLERREKERTGALRSTKGPCARNGMVDVLSSRPPPTCKIDN